MLGIILIYSSKIWTVKCKHNLFIFFSVPMGITGKTMGSMFAPVPVEIACYEPETVGCKGLKLS